MGTHGLLGFIIRGQRHAAFNQYDSYPSGLGVGIIEFILSLMPEEYDTMARLVSEVIWVKPESKPSKEVQDRYQKLGFSVPDADEYLSDWYYLLHKTQGAPALRAIHSGELQHMSESIGFLADMTCLWAYFVDLRTRNWRYGWGNI